MSTDHGSTRVVGLRTVVEPGLRDYLAVLGRRKAVVIWFTVLVVGVAVASGLVQTERYTSTAHVLIESRASDQQLDQSVQQLVVDRKRIIDTEVRILGSEPVRRAVERRFGADTPTATAAAEEGTDLVSVTVTSTDPALAAAVANETARQYIAYRTERTKSDLVDAAKSVQSQLDRANARVRALDAKLARLPDGPELDATQADRTSAAQAARNIKSQLDALNLQSTLTTGNATLVDPAQRSSTPVSPQPVKSGILALFAGAIFGVVLAFVVEFFDDRIETQSALEGVLPEQALLGLVPRFAPNVQRAGSHIAVLDADGSPASEAYRGLRTAVQFLAGQQGLKTIQVTSSESGEGKTTTAVNLAVMYALAGHKTVLIDADLRQPRVHVFLQISNAVGLTTALLEGSATSVCGVPLLQDHRLMAIPAGPRAAHPAELLQSKRFRRVLDDCMEDADVVIIDSPPILPVADAVALSSLVDGVVFVVSADSSTKRNVRRATDLLANVDANVCGVVLNGVKASELGVDGYYAGYGPHAPKRGLDRFFRPEPVGAHASPAKPRRKGRDQRRPHPSIDLNQIEAEELIEEPQR